jgi:hypothetical protein
MAQDSVTARSVLADRRREIMAKKSGGKTAPKKASPDALAQAGKPGAGELSEVELDGVSGGTAIMQNAVTSIAQEAANVQAAEQKKIASAAHAMNPFVPGQ